ncbi:hypothetical protein ARMSODRAFT_227227 [Armillaria solidipes]|uniref:Uncharacterized protein n=1 Tax=Armillaria solidipes TaxID=1076256 RepID=A0A2H3C037_9AGAR|nr:hypothetical protein ARMSODRAFT_227227 [Armillaria solidipes]
MEQTLFSIMFPAAVASQLEIQKLPLAMKNRLCILNDIFGLESMARSPGCTAFRPRIFETLLPASRGLLASLSKAQNP